MIEALALLLPFAAASGWYAAKRSMRRELLARRTARRQPGLARGLGLLLQDRLDEAMDVLTPVIEAEAEGLELRLTLGGFFRRRGEIEKAIALHQAAATVSGPGLDERAAVVFELGLDYLGAGLLDRAEQAFVELRQVDGFRADALHQLVRIYQLQRDWQQSLDCALELRRLDRLNSREPVAQFYCELAEQQLASGSESAAIDLLRTALRGDSSCVRASMILARVLMRRGCWMDALAALENVEHQDPDFLPEIVAPLVECLQRAGLGGELPDRLSRLQSRQGSIEAVLLTTDHLRRTGGGRVARQYLQRILPELPSLEIAGELLRLLTEDECTGVGLDAAAQVLTAHAQRTPRYRCVRCGFCAGDLHWHCPSCQNWATVKPFRPHRDLDHKPEKNRR